MGIVLLWIQALRSDAARMPGGRAFTVLELDRRPAIVPASGVLALHA